jgi:glycosyltransferase involved in cell wall biosynthesis
MSKTPLLSVFIPAFNAAAYVREAVESVLDNGFTDFELVVVDDGSTDHTADVVAAIRHPALRLVRQPVNLGVGATRHSGIAGLSGRYLGLLDADDIAVHGRFEQQIAQLEAREGPDIIGGAIENFGEGAGVVSFPIDDAAIRAGLLFHDLPLANPAVCMRLAPLCAGRIAYAQTGGAEDYALWADALIAGLRFANLPVVVTRMRRHAASLTRSAAAEVSIHARVVRRRIADHFFPQMTVIEREALVNALSVNLGGGRRWIDGACAIAHAAALAPTVAGADAAVLRELLKKNFLRMLRHALANRLVDNEVLEMMTETNTHFERWRMAGGGSLDADIMALLTPDP